ncbi:MAG: hypothetical protein ACI9WS_003029 [Paraglaciecola psychrophila]|jgi:hypothetical protein
MSNSDELVNKINSETSKIAWSELQKFYAQGLVVAVERPLDLIATAAIFSQDDKTQVQQWLDDKQVYRVEDEQAQSWYQREVLLWAVVVAPFVLVQELDASED